MPPDPSPDARASGARFIDLPPPPPYPVTKNPATALDTMHIIALRGQVQYNVDFLVKAILRIDYGRLVFTLYIKKKTTAKIRSSLHQITENRTNRSRFRRQGKRRKIASSITYPKHTFNLSINTSPEKPRIQC